MDNLPMTKATDLGTEDLEKGLIPSPARNFVVIATIAVLVLLVFNSKALVEWTRQPRPGAVIAALEDPAVRWHGYMVELGTASLVPQFRRIILNEQ